MTLSIAGLSAAPNRRVTDHVRFVADGVEVVLPLILINGAEPGPTLLVTAGIHGAEYPCVEAAARLGRTLDPAATRGRVVIAPMANPVAFRARSIYISPPDGKNLNRQFPGDPEGSFSQVLAHWLFTELIQHADYYIDLHGGDMIEALMPFGCCVQTGNAQLDASAESMAKTFGLPYIVLSERNSIAGTTHMAAADVGIPALLAEAGGQGLLTEDDVVLLERGVRRVMGALDMLSDVDAPAEAPRRFDGWRWLRAEAEGLFYPTVSVGGQVQAGQDLGQIADIFGKPLQDVQAPIDGEVLFLVTSLAINNGDPLLCIVA